MLDGIDHLLSRRWCIDVTRLWVLLGLIIICGAVHLCVYWSLSFIVPCNVLLLEKKKEKKNSKNPKKKKKEMM